MVLGARGFYVARNGILRPVHEKFALVRGSGIRVASGTEARRGRLLGGVVVAGSAAVVVGIARRVRKAVRSGQSASAGCLGSLVNPPADYDPWNGAPSRARTR